MYPSLSSISDIAGAIQLALAPVFLLTGIAGMLNVMTGRLSRIIDRGRFLTDDEEEASNPAAVQAELNMLQKRGHLTGIAITMCTIAALLVCLVIVCLFLEALAGIQLNWLIGTLFTLGTLALVTGLAFFLREVHISARSIRVTISKRRK